MISAACAKWYTREQRLSLCKWCKEQGKADCAKCGITQIPPKETEDKKRKGRSK